MVEVETVEIGGRVHGVPATFCHILPSFYYILPTGRCNIVEVKIVETGRYTQGVMGWFYNRTLELYKSLKLLLLITLV